MFNMSKWAEAKRPTEKHGRPSGMMLLFLTVLVLTFTLSSCLNPVDSQVGDQAAEKAGGSISSLSTELPIPAWTPSSDPNDYYSTVLTGGKVEPINIVVRGPIGTLDNLKRRLEVAGTWFPMASQTGLTLPCFNTTVTYKGSGIEFMWTDDLSGSDGVFQQCGSGTRNHARVWREQSFGGPVPFETIYIAASFETVRGAFPIPPPTHPFSPQAPVSVADSEVFYMGRTNANVTTSCSNPVAAQNEAWHFRAVVPNGASVEYLTDDLNISNPGVTVWRNSTLGCDFRGSWPMVVQPNVALSNANGQVLDLYVVPFQAAADGHPADRQSYPTGRQPFYLQVTSGATTQDVAVRSCDTYHCLTEDSFNLGRDDLFFHLDNALRDQGVGITAFALDEHYVGNTAFIRQPDDSDGYEFRSDGRIRVINITSLPLFMDEPLNYTGTFSPPIVGTNCANPTATSGVQQNAVFDIARSFSFNTDYPDYYPKRLINGEGGVWRNSSLGCSPNGNWPMYVDDTLNDFVISMVPYGALPYTPNSSGYYILELGTDDPSDPLIYAKLEW